MVEGIAVQGHDSCCAAADQVHCKMQAIAAIAVGPHVVQRHACFISARNGPMLRFSQRGRTPNQCKPATLVFTFSTSHDCWQPGPCLMRELSFGQVVVCSHPWSLRHWESAAGSVMRDTQPEVVGTVMLEML